jgi:hypothetical protein
VSRKKNKNQTAGASAEASAPASAGATVFIKSKICLAGAITLRVGMNEVDSATLSRAVEKSPGLDRQLRKLAATGLISVSQAPPPPPAPEPAPPPPEPVVLEGKTAAELEALLSNAQSAEEANAITEALRAADKDPAT